MFLAFSDQLSQWDWGDFILSSYNNMGIFYDKLHYRYVTYISIELQGHLERLHVDLHKRECAALCCLTLTQAAASFLPHPSGHNTWLSNNLSCFDLKGNLFLPISSCSTFRSHPISFHFFWIAPTWVAHSLILYTSTSCSTLPSSTFTCYIPNFYSCMPVLFCTWKTSCQIKASKHLSLLWAGPFPILDKVWAPCSQGGFFFFSRSYLPQIVCLPFYSS